MRTTAPKHTATALNTAHFGHLMQKAHFPNRPLRARFRRKQVVEGVSRIKLMWKPDQHLPLVPPIVTDARSGLRFRLLASSQPPKTALFPIRVQVRVAEIGNLTFRAILCHLCCLRRSSHGIYTPFSFGRWIDAYVRINWAHQKNRPPWATCQMPCMCPPL